MIYKTTPRKIKIEQHEPHLCYSCYKPCDKSSMRKGPNCDYDKRNISMVICNTNIRLKYCDLTRFFEEVCVTYCIQILTKAVYGTVRVRRGGKTPEITPRTRQ